MKEKKITVSHTKKVIKVVSRNFRVKQISLNLKSLSIYSLSIFIETQKVVQLQLSFQKRVI